MKGVRIRAPERRLPLMLREVVRLFGRVQGVGFRDRVLDISSRYRVTGTVRNLRMSEALEIDVEGPADDVAAFVADVLAHPPAFARVTMTERVRRAPRGVSGFTRAKSR